MMFGTELDYQDSLFELGDKKNLIFEFESIVSYLIFNKNIMFEKDEGVEFVIFDIKRNQHHLSFKLSRQIINTIEYNLKNNNNIYHREAWEELKVALEDDWMRKEWNSRF